MKKRTTFLYLALGVITLLACTLTSQQTTTKAAAVARSERTQSDARRPGVQASTPTPAARCTVAAQHLNFRACAGTDCAVLDVLEEGAVLDVLTFGDWYQVRTATGQRGYISARYCNLLQKTEN